MFYWELNHSEIPYATPSGTRVAYFPYVTLLSVISFNDVTIPAFATLLNELNASLPQCCLELWRWQAGLFY